MKRETKAREGKERKNKEKGGIGKERKGWERQGKERKEKDFPHRRTKNKVGKEWAEKRRERVGTGRNDE